MSIVQLAIPRADFLAPGTRMGRYELLQRLAIGGMAELYLARSTGIQGFAKLVALKRILPQHAANEDFVAMFLDEARLAATLRHANVAQVYDIGQCERGLFFTMEFIHGEDVRAMLRTSSRRGRRVPLEHALAIACGAAAGLHAAHVATGLDGEPLGIVHRDVSPSNVLVSFDGCVKVIDFGVAKATRRRSATRSGTLKGKVSYMSPEQCCGGAMDHRSDVFALGILLFELTTGTRLFQADNEFAIMQQIVWGDAEPPSTRVEGYPPALERIVLRALARDRDARYPTAQALQLDLERLARDLGLTMSSAALGTYMRELFAGRLEIWQHLQHAAGDGGVVELPLPAPEKSAPVAAPEPKAVPVIASESDTEPHDTGIAAQVDQQIHLVAEATRGDTGEPVHTGLFDIRLPILEPARPGHGRMIAMLSVLALASALLAWTLRPQPSPDPSPVSAPTTAQPATPEASTVTAQPATTENPLPRERGRGGVGEPGTDHAVVTPQPAVDAAVDMKPEPAHRPQKRVEARPDEHRPPKRSRPAERKLEPAPPVPPPEPEPPPAWDLDSPLPPS